MTYLCDEAPGGSVGGDEREGITVRLVVKVDERVKVGGWVGKGG